MKKNIWTGCSSNDILYFVRKGFYLKTEIDTMKKKTFSMILRIWPFKGDGLKGRKY